jgi:hypothetical protein
MRETELLAGAHSDIKSFAVVPLAYFHEVILFSMMAIGFQFSESGPALIGFHFKFLYDILSIAPMAYMVNSTAFTVIKAESRMMVAASNQPRAPMLKAQTFQGSCPPRAVSKAPRMVNPVPNHFDAGNHRDWLALTVFVLQGLHLQALDVLLADVLHGAEHADFGFG